MNLPDWLTNVDLWSVVLGAIVMLLGTKYPIAVAVIKLIIDRLKAPADPSPKPVDPNHPVTTPPASPDHPLMNAAIELLKKLAKERFPWLPIEAAVVRFAAEDLRRHGDVMAEAMQRDVGRSQVAPAESKATF